MPIGCSCVVVDMVHLTDFFTNLDANAATNGYGKPSLRRLGYPLTDLQETADPQAVVIQSRRVSEVWGTEMCVVGMGCVVGCSILDPRSQRCSRGQPSLAKSLIVQIRRRSRACWLLRIGLYSRNDGQTYVERGPQHRERRPSRTQANQGAPPRLCANGSVSPAHVPLARCT